MNEQRENKRKTIPSQETQLDSSPQKKQKTEQPRSLKCEESLSIEESSSRIKSNPLSESEPLKLWEANFSAMAGADHNSFDTPSASESSDEETAHTAIPYFETNFFELEQNASGLQTYAEVIAWIDDYYDFIASSFQNLKLKEWLDQKISSTQSIELRKTLSEYQKLLRDFSTELLTLLTHEDTVDVRKAGLDSAIQGEVFPDAVACFIDVIIGLQGKERASTEIGKNYNYLLFFDFLQVNENVAKFLASKLPTIESVAKLWNADHHRAIQHTSSVLTEKQEALEENQQTTSTTSSTSTENVLENTNLTEVSLLTKSMGTFLNQRSDDTPKELKLNDPILVPDAEAEAGDVNNAEIQNTVMTTLKN